MAGSEKSFFQRITYTEGIYPVLTANAIQNPNRFFAVPLLGLLIKIIILIPVLIEQLIVTIWYLIVTLLINPLVVLFTGKYWDHAYKVALGFFRLGVKISFFFFGLTDKYPGFSLSVNEAFSLDIQKPENPKRIYAIPFFGGLVRFIFLIPYIFFVDVIAYAAAIGGMYLAWAVVLFKGRYPEGVFELVRDSTRTGTASAVYIIGLSDRYPSFYISMAHDKIKIILIVIAIILQGWNFSSSFFSPRERNDSVFEQKYGLNDRVIESCIIGWYNNKV